jgi:methionyl-tRNA formyltransferase
MRYAFAGDRQLSCEILSHLINLGYKPSALLVTEGAGSSHVQKLIHLADLSPDLVFYGKNFSKPKNIQRLNNLELDYIFGIHFPYIIPNTILKIPKVGFLNLHPSYLPYNKGWHTPTWALLHNNPYGATLHFMTEKLDEGDIVNQKKIDILPVDTADSLYQRVLKVEKEVFIESIEDLVSLNPPRKKQNKTGTSYYKKDLKKIRKIDLDTKIDPRSLINKLRALTTNSHDEAAFFEDQGKKIGVRVELFEIE